MTNKDVIFVCTGGCGDFTIEEMTQERDDGSHSWNCPKCFGDAWYIVPDNDLPKEKENKQIWLRQDLYQLKED